MLKNEELILKKGMKCLRENLDLNSRILFEPRPPMTLVKNLSGLKYRG
jgi:hypothetical protein